MIKSYTDISWDFRKENTKSLTHGFHPYPAMMIPQIAKRLIEKYGKGGYLLDPYCGTGTSLVEAQVAGMKSYGIDINPLARLISKVKTTPIESKLLIENLEKIEHIIRTNRNENNDSKTAPRPEYFNIDFWFSDVVVKRLAILKTAILKIKEEEVRDFYFVVFSRVVRESSYQRSGEFKLYRIQKEKIDTHKADVFGLFVKYAKSNIEGMKDYFAIVKKSVWSKVLDADTRNGTEISAKSIDIVVTSPPYGDSQTTVAYGQFSRLALQWLDFKYDEIKNIDKVSLGGYALKEKDNELGSKTLNKYVSLIEKQDIKRSKQVMSFYVDFDLTLKEIDRLMKINGYMCYVVGNRTVKGVQIETDKIMVELMEKRKYDHIETIVRNIPNKRMPAVNSPSNIKGQTSGTMVNEYIVVMKKMS